MSPQVSNIYRPPGVEAGFCVTLDAEGVSYLVFSDIDETVDLQEVERRLIYDAVRAARDVLSIRCDGPADDDWLSDYCCRLATYGIRDPVLFTNYIISSYNSLVRVNKGMLSRDLYLVHCACASLTERDCMIAQSRLIEAYETR